MKGCANNAIEDADLDGEDEALFAMMLDESLSSASMTAVIHTLNITSDGDC